MTGEEWRDVLDANLTTAFLCCQAVAPGMKAARLGPHRQHLLGRGPGPQQDRHPGLHQRQGRRDRADPAAGHELGPSGITVNCIAPGFVLSNPTTEQQWEGYGPDGQRALVGGIAMRRLGEPADIANGVRFFAAPPSSWVTGQVIAIDGGHA